MAAMMLRRGGHKQLTFDLRLDEGTHAMDARWRDASENEKKSRARFAQNAMKPAEVAPEWNKVKDLLGSPDDENQMIEEQFGLAFENVKVKYTVQADDHSAGDEHEIEYDIAQGV